MANGGGVRPGRFFRAKLLSGAYDEIQEQLAFFAEERKQLREQIVSICWHMRGGVTRDEAWALSYRERRDIVKFITERIKVVERTGLALL